MLDRQGSPVDKLTDGDTIRIRVTLAQPANQETPIEVHLGGLAPLLASCTIRAAEAGCATEPLVALGWYWEDAGRSVPIRTIEATAGVASFALYDTSRSLQVTRRGANRNVIDLSPDHNGLVVVDDPAALFYLGYGFPNPKPGEWNITLLSTPRTPAAGADYSLAAHLEGGATFVAHLSRLLPQVDQPMNISVDINLGSSSLALSQAPAAIRGPNGACRHFL